MRIQHNITALNANRQLASNNTSVSKNLEKLSSGFRINRAGDDAAGLAISEKMRAQISGLDTAKSNAEDGISLVQTAEGALTEVHSMLNRMVELADQSANGTYSDAVDRDNLQNELNSLRTEVNRISEGTNFNGIALLDGTMSTKAVTAAAVAANATGTTGTVAVSVSADNAGAAMNDKDITFATGAEGVVVDGATGDVAVTLVAGKAYTEDDINTLLSEQGAGMSLTLSGATTGTDMAVAGTLTLANGANEVSTLTEGLTLQIGDTSDSFNQLTVSVGAMDATGLGINAINISTQAGAQDAIEDIKAAINTVSSTRGDLGATQNRLEHTINNLSVTSENMSSAESRIRDVDMAKEMMEFTKNNILSQASQSMLAQANQLPQGVLQLLQ
ncbi:flagellin N-terminal helical domain-containing protein [Parasporobacterium paucivorans]|uniref:Flagellin n=1 Tax=Parasporobacterium paucivorans DSM 15970 TaxID=1122934 RepID=A0A1M6I762_9FIRM|nr:flagellin [Parasporobacterium paucivorans]SHJ30242.1 flagellin [Parasporobacterium paucivorans DSM 15970]